MTPAHRSFRLVAPAGMVPLIQELLLSQGYVSEPEPFSPFAFRLIEEPVPLGRSLAASFGYVYIQDRSSMLPPLALAPQPGSTVLDMCASPGSKTGLLAQLVGISGLVLGNEPNPARLATLRRNLYHLNLAQAVTCCHPGERLPMPPEMFDLIQLDPPCSGWGTTDRNPDVLKLWQGDKVLPLIRLQRALLAEALRLLKPGGRLVYSTCTTNVEENEGQIRFAREELGLLPVALPPLPGFVYEASALPDVDGVLRVDEDASDAQGFFIAALTKPTVPSDSPEKTAKLAPTYGGTAGTWHPLPPEQAILAGLDPSALPPGAYGVFSDTVHMLPEAALQQLPASLRWQGMVLGRASAGQFRPYGRLHACLSHEEHGPVPPIPRVDIDDIAPLSALLQGQSLSLGIKGRAARLFWRNLPLGLLTLKNGRAMWSEK